MIELDTNIKKETWIGNKEPESPNNLTQQLKINDTGNEHHNCYYKGEKQEIIQSMYGRDFTESRGIKF